MVDYMIMYNIYSKAKLFTYNRIVFPIFGDYIMEDCKSYANEDDLVCDTHYEDMRYDLD
jgi:hypothetical protein